MDTWQLVRRFGTDVVRNPDLLPAGQTEEFEAALTRYHGYTTAVLYVALVALLLVFVRWLRYERSIIVDELAGEVDAGVLTGDEHRLLASVVPRWRCYLAHARRGRSVAHMRLLHERLTELAVLKRRTRLFDGDSSAIVRTRAEVALLRDYSEKLAALRTEARGRSGRFGPRRSSLESVQPETPPPTRPRV